MIGDPSGRSDMRQMMTVETIQHNIDCFKKQMERFIDFSDGKAFMVNNADWLMNLNYVEVLRDVGPHFFDLFFVCYLGNQTTGFQLVPNCHCLFPPRNKIKQPGSCPFRTRTGSRDTT